MQGKTLIVIFFALMSSLLIQGQDDLVGYWSFDDAGVDTILDHSGNGNYGINYGAERVPGIRGKALYFGGKETDEVEDTKASRSKGTEQDGRADSGSNNADGTQGKAASTEAMGDFVEIKGSHTPVPSVLKNLGTGSISVWFKVHEIPTEYGIAPILYYGMRDKCDFLDAANKGLIIELGHSPIYPKNESLFFTIWKNGCTLPSFCYDTNFPVSKNEWHHFVAVVGEDYNTGYLDGEELNERKYNFGDDTYSQFFADALAHDKMWLGRGHWDRTTQFFNGVIDELKIFSKPLSRREVREMYNSLVTPTANVSSVDTKNDISVYPNPASDKLHYDIAELDEEVEAIRIMDISGKLFIYKEDVDMNGNLDISNLPDGLYFIEFFGKETVFKKKIVVRHESF